MGRRPPLEGTPLAAGTTNELLTNYEGMTRVLVIEDEPGLVMALTQRLSSEGYAVETAGDGNEGLARGTAEPFDVIILDLMLPHKSGFDVCRDLRQRGINTPIIMLTARGQVVDRVVGLKLGADDYLTKPFAMMELLARIEALLRRSSSAHVSAGSGAASPQIYRFRSICVDFRRTAVTKNNRPVDMSAREFKLLHYLIEHAGATVSRDELLNEVWGYNTMTTTRTVDVHISLLRQKIEEDPRHPKSIVTVHGFGYKFVEC
ncbi:MAG TPA: response regulator transcription factor [Blastocatellia bacterium]|nr:response regulator transcription factor [Blastocatellia bacterium]